jgi:hypothetical protein
MAGTNPNTDGNFIRRHTAQNFTDTATGFPFGGTAVATAFNAPQYATGGWAANEGTAAKYQTNTANGPQPAYVGGPGIAFCPAESGATPDAYHNAASGPSSNGCTIIMSVRTPMNKGAVTSTTNPASLSGALAHYHSIVNGAQTHNITIGYDQNRAIFAGVDSAIATSPGVQLLAGREIIVLRGNSDNSVSASVLRGGGLKSVTGGASTTFTTGFNFIGSATASNFGYGVIEDITQINAVVNDANCIAYATWVRDTQADAFVTPTTQLDIIGDSITAGYDCSNCACYVAYLEAALRPKGVVINPQGILSADAVTWANSTFFNSMIKAATANGIATITKRLGLMFLGANQMADLIATDATTWIGQMNTVADAYVARTGAQKPWAVVPLCRFGNDMAAKETLRRTYRTALLASSHFSGIIDTDTLAPFLVPATTTAYEAQRTMGSPWFQNPVNASGQGLRLDGTFVLNSKSCGTGGLHPGILGHQALATMMLNDSASGFGMAVGSLASGGNFGRNRRFSRF